MVFGETYLNHKVSIFYAYFSSKNTESIESISFLKCQKYKTLYCNSVMAYCFRGKLEGRD